MQGWMSGKEFQGWDRGGADAGVDEWKGVPGGGAGGKELTHWWNRTGIDSGNWYRGEVGGRLN